MAEEDAQEQQVDGPLVDYETKYREALAHSREWEKRAKANSNAAEELKKLKESRMSEAEKAQAHIDDLETQLAQYRTRDEQAAWRQKISKETGVPEDAVYGTSEEEMRENAQKIKPLLRTVNAPLVPGADRQPTGSPDSKKEQEIDYIHNLFHSNR